MSNCVCLGFSRNINCPVYGEPHKAIAKEVVRLLGEGSLNNSLKEIESLQFQISELKSELEKEKKVVDFYANTRNWSDLSYCGINNCMSPEFEDDHEDIVISEKEGFSCCGKLARQRQRGRK